MINFPKHNFIAEFFNQTLTKERLARSYLLTGNDKEAKLDLFKQINMILNCHEAEGACGICQNCRWIADGKHPRTPIFLSPSADSHKQVIKVEQIRALQSELAQSSEFFRLIIIEDASSHCLNASSSAALLKTIEEARADTLFMLMAESKQSVLSTIVSRSQVFVLNDNSEQEFDEVSKELADNLQEFLASNLASSRLQQLIKAEQISGQENKDLIAALQILQNKSEGSSLNDAEQVMRYERAIANLKSFVRPQLVVSDLLY